MFHWWQKKHITKEKKTLPSIGLKPKNIHDAERLEDIKAAINRKTESSEKINLEWIEEYNDLAEELKCLKQE